MQEFGKIFCVVAFGVTAAIAGICWIEDRPTLITWFLRFAFTLAALTALGLLLYLQFRRDSVPDFLREIADAFYFNRDGFCFIVFARKIDDAAYFVIAFQNQREKPCHSKVALRPASGFWPYNETFPTIYFDVDCGPAAFGYSCVPVPLPLDLQGKAKKFEIGASVVFLSGKGRRIRFRDGQAVRVNAEFKDTFGTILSVALAMLGGVHLLVAILHSNQRAIVQVHLPTFVSEELCESDSPYTETHWTLGEPVL